MLNVGAYAAAAAAESERARNAEALKQTKLEAAVVAALEAARRSLAVEHEPNADEKEMNQRAQDAASQSLEGALARHALTSTTAGASAGDSFRSAFAVAGARARVQRETEALVRARLASQSAQAVDRAARRAEVDALARVGVRGEHSDALAAAQAVAQRRWHGEATFLRSSHAATSAAAGEPPALPLPQPGDDSLLAALDAALAVTRCDRRLLQSALELLLGFTTLLPCGELDVLERALRDSSAGASAAPSRDAEARQLARRYASELDADATLRPAERVCLRRLLHALASAWAAADARGEAALALHAGRPHPSPRDTCAGVRDAKMRAMFPSAPWRRQGAASSAADGHADGALTGAAALREHLAHAALVERLARFGLPLSAEERGAVAPAALPPRATQQPGGQAPAWLHPSLAQHGGAVRKQQPPTWREQWPDGWAAASHEASWRPQGWPEAPRASHAPHRSHAAPDAGSRAAAPSYGRAGMEGWDGVGQQGDWEGEGGGRFHPHAHAFLPPPPPPPPPPREWWAAPVAGTSDARFRAQAAHAGWQGAPGSAGSDAQMRGQQQVSMPVHVPVPRGGVPEWLRPQTGPPVRAVTGDEEGERDGGSSQGGSRRPPQAHQQPPPPPPLRRPLTAPVRPRPLQASGAAPRRSRQPQEEDVSGRSSSDEEAPQPQRADGTPQELPPVHAGGARHGSWRPRGAAAPSSVFDPREEFRAAREEADDNGYGPQRQRSRAPERWDDGFGMDLQPRRR